ncbi:MAG: 50S ribosomal protein L24e [Candidatus Parvarchaeota archaeon]|nr:50S ribosomal protein L24e [Candidatus Parvarchaeota archaeon]MCL5017726.1 50S ribosomal protein L24e [Candidatus Parvarchaeota archaeon]
MKCSFCNSEIKRGTGIMYAKNDGTVYNLCSRRCMTYIIMKKDQRKFKWARDK